MRNLRILLLLALLAAAAHGAQADGLADLKAALQRPSGTQALKATLSVSTQHRRGDGDDAVIDQGAATLTIDDSALGLQVLYGVDLLARAQSEQLAHENDGRAKTPTVDGLRALDQAAIRAMSMAGDSLKRTLARATFKSERTERWHDQPARLLSFDLGPGKLSEQDRKYVKHTEGSLQVWIAADGTPLESRSQLKLSGRAMVVISFESSMSATAVYQRVGDRLIATRLLQLNASSGAGDKAEDRAEFSLQPVLRAAGS